MNIHCHFKQAITNIASRFLFLLPFFFFCFSASVQAEEQYIYCGSAILKTSPASGQAISFDSELDSTYLSVLLNYSGLNYAFKSASLAYKFQLVITFSGTGKLEKEVACGRSVQYNASSNLTTITTTVEYSGNPNQAPFCNDFLFWFDGYNGALDVCNINFYVANLCEG